MLDVILITYSPRNRSFRRYLAEERSSEIFGGIARLEKQRSRNGLMSARQTTKDNLHCSDFGTDLESPHSFFQES